ncbi:hypothetical protein BXZ70DRAFT_958592 [Cristinia sonorae]|uniref:Uncharacterized protein n=1 Tax=Cristinia sonorae TaxID=1940300 RepID=A0A8K0XKG9_9AGAR|nr:hypothetical protein BXZ70DRAFT_958592 [Cristinia sonorae]
MLGSAADMRRRQTKQRVDDHPRRSTIERVRGWIYNLGYSLTSVFLKRVLDAKSWVPTRNAFSDKLSSYGFNFYKMLAPDLLHEFELGTWKAVFIHLLRVLYAAGGDRIQQLNERYRQMPTFGRGVIRRFTHNTSAMKKLAARDWEDLLQCAMPVFEGLLLDPEQPNSEIWDSTVQDLLFILATWHASAKLPLGRILRRFKTEVCSCFHTYDLPTEDAARVRRRAANARKGKKSTGTTAGAKRRRYFNMETYKLHSLGDYLLYARLFGPSDNYSTQVGELEHRRVKRFYVRTNKHRFVRQIAKQHRREEIMRKLIARQRAAQVATTQAKASTAANGSSNHDSMLSGASSLTAAADFQSHPQNQHLDARSPTVSFSQTDPLPKTPPQEHHHMSQDTTHKLHLYAWLVQCESQGDQATKDFLPMLRDHLYARLSGTSQSGEYSDSQRSRVHIVQDKLHIHKVLRINYTTYDIRRAQDSLNARNHGDIMVLNPEVDTEAPFDGHPYWFARIAGIFHVMAKLLNEDGTLPYGPPQRIEFLWVRWFERVPSQPAWRWSSLRLPAVQFVKADQDGAFGFLDPNDVIRGVHMLPGCKHGRTKDFLGKSVARPPHNGKKPDNDGDTDWRRYYVGIFVDRDMFMRFRGGGVGHRSTQGTFSNVSVDDVEVAVTAADDDPGTETEIAQPEEEQDPTLNSEENTGSGGPDAAEPEDEDEEDDYGYKGNNSEDDDVEKDEGLEGDGVEDDDEPEDDELGAEDGEDSGDDAEDELGYAPL